MDNEEIQGGVSRRTAIKSVAAGGALVWAAPAITTLGGSAFAQVSPVPQCPGTNWECDDVLVECGASGPLEYCLCDTTVEGATFCWEDQFCEDLQPCSSSDTCDPGYACVTTCCPEPMCFPVCGTNANVVNDLTQSTGGATGSSR